MKKIKITIAMIIGIAFITGTSIYSLTGYDVMKKVEDNDTSRNVKYKAKMVLNGQRTLKFDYWRLKRGKNSKTMLKFTAPALDKNTGLLTFNYANKNKKSDQWIFLANLNDTKRILSSEKGKSFMGSDFYYEDFEKVNLDKYNYKLKSGTKKVHGKECYVVTIKAKPGVDSAYTKVKSWVDVKDFVIRKSLFYVKGRLKKVAYQTNIKKIQGIFTPLRLEMRTLSPPHKTIMTIKNVRYNTRINNSFFTKRYLQRKR